MTETQHTMGTFTGVRNVSIFYQRRIPAQGIQRGVIVLVHGLGEHSDRYNHVYDRLLPEGYAFYALDHRGFGRSGGRQGHVDRFDDYLLDVQQLVEMARREGPEWPPVLYGHSMGGLISLAYALQYPDAFRHLVITSPALANPPRAGRILMALARALSRLYPTFTLDNRGSGGASLSRDAAEVARADSDPLCHPWISLRWVAEFTDAQRRVMEQATALAATSVLMMQGTDDLLVLPEATETFYRRLPAPDRTLIRYPGYYHELHNDLGRERPLDDLATWLNERLPRRTVDIITI